MASRFLEGITGNLKVSDKLIKLLPKTDLHCHLDGSMRLSTLIDLAVKQSIELPSYDPEELQKKIFKNSYKDLDDYLAPFKYMTSVMRDEESLERVAFEFAEDCYSEGVRYFEVRFGPHLHAVPNRLSAENVVIAVNKGLEKATKIFNNLDADVQKGIAPKFKYGIIICCMRYFNEDLSPYYRNFCQIFKYESRKTMFGVASLQLAKMSVQMRDTQNIPIVALDIAGCEAGYPATHHVEAFRYAHENYMNKTIHAGEAYGPESIFQAVTACYAERIGHGLKMFDDTSFQPEIPVSGKQKYVDGLIRFIANQRICVEVCLTSNYQTDPSLRANPSLHPLKKLLKEKIPVCLNTDNRMVSRTTMCDEIRLAVDIFNLDRDDIRQIIRHGFKRSFMPGSYPDKKEYINQITSFYDKIVDDCDSESSGNTV